MHVGHILRQVRIQQSLTREQLSDLTPVDTEGKHMMANTIGRIEREGNPTLNSLDRICAGLNICSGMILMAASKPNDFNRAFVEGVRQVLRLSPLPTV